MRSLYKFASLALILVLALSSISAARADDVDDPDVVVLTVDNFDSFIESEETTLVEFYAPWCGHCKRLAPEYAKAATELLQLDTPIKIAKVDATEHRSLGTRFSVSGYPTLKVFQNGKPRDYNGPREADGIVAYMKKQAGPAAKEVADEAALDKYLSDGNFWVLGLFDKDSSSRLNSAFIVTANRQRDHYTFLKSSNEALRAKYGVEGEAIIAVKTFDDKATVFDGQTSTDLEKFIDLNSLPVVGPITEQNEADYRRHRLPILQVFTQAVSENVHKYYYNRVGKVAEAERGNLLVGLRLISAFPHLTSEFGINAKDNNIVVITTPNGENYKYDGKFSARDIKEFVQKWKDGKVEKHIKSEPIPEDNDGPVKVVVGKQFDEIVMDPEKDVLIEFYAPWCGHCKQLAPLYEKLGKKLARFKDVVIAKIDATANDYNSQFQVSGYPSIFFVPAKKDATPIKYEGAREVDDFKAFIKKNAAKPFKKSKKSKKN